MHYEQSGYADAMETEAGVVVSSWVRLELEQLFSKALPESPTFPSRVTFSSVDSRPLVCGADDA